MAEQNLLFTGVFAAGLLSFFAPCTFPLIPVYIGILSDEKGEYKSIRLGGLNINTGAIIKTLAFLLGLSTSFVILGFGAGFLGSFLANRWVLVAAGVLVVVLGIHQMDIIHIKKLDMIGGINFESNRTKALGSYLIGISFSLGWTPCVGPMLGAVLAVSASRGQALYGGLLMLVYTLGLAVPFVVMVIISDFIMSKLGFVRKHLVTIKRIGGFLVVLMGIALMTSQLGSITSVIENFLKI